MTVREVRRWWPAAAVPASQRTGAEQGSLRPAAAGPGAGPDRGAFARAAAGPGAACGRELPLCQSFLRSRDLTSVCLCDPIRSLFALIYCSLIFVFDHFQFLIILTKYPAQCIVVLDKVYFSLLFSSFYLLHNFIYSSIKIKTGLYFLFLCCRIFTDGSKPGSLSCRGQSAQVSARSRCPSLKDTKLTCARGSSTERREVAGCSVPPLQGGRFPTFRAMNRAGQLDFSSREPRGDAGRD